MRPNPVPFSVLAAALSACVVEPELLNSERIEAQFGSFGISIISYQGGIRRANLYSNEANRRVCRTYAIVQFDDVTQESIGNEHAQIVAGASIGATFKANGWRIFKETRYVGELALTNHDHPIAVLMRLEGTPELAMHVYRLFLRKGPQLIEYATIIEVHHPEYLTRSRLKELFAVDRMDNPKPSQLAEWTRLVNRQH